MKRRRREGVSRFGFPVPGMMTKHYNSEGLSSAIKEDHKQYREALELMKEARRRSRDEGGDYTDYFVGRLRFAVRYLDAAESYGSVARALKAKRRPEALRHAEAAYEAIREALQVYADVARDHGDLGAVALMNEYCYRPIQDKRNQLKQEINHEQRFTTKR